MKPSFVFVKPKKFEITNLSPELTKLSVRVGEVFASRRSCFVALSLHIFVSN